MELDLHYIYDWKRAVKKVHPFAKVKAEMLRILERFCNVPRVFEYGGDGTYTPKP